MDREEIFQLLKLKDFSSIINLLKGRSDVVKEDIILQQAVRYFFNEIITSAKQNPNSDNNFNIAQLFILHTKNFFKFSEEQFEDIVLHLSTKSSTLNDAYFYACALPEHPICKQVIQNHLDNQPKPISHTQESKIQVHEISSEILYLAKSIFNSKLEKTFFFALRNCFPMHYIYPNIALSTIIKLTNIEKHLSDIERRFFYNTTIDFVVIDQFDDFKPLFAIELDSEWHRTDTQSVKDEIKK